MRYYSSVILLHVVGNAICILCSDFILYSFLDLLVICVICVIFFSSEKMMDLLLDLWFLLECVPAFVFKFLLWSLIFCLDLEFDL